MRFPVPAIRRAGQAPDLWLLFFFLPLALVEERIFFFLVSPLNALSQLEAYLGVVPTRRIVTAFLLMPWQ